MHRTETKTKKTHYQKVYRADRRARRFITAGGYGIVVSIIAILLFLVYQSLPLAKGASIKELFSFSIGKTSTRALLTGVDAYQEVFYTMDEGGTVQFYRLADNNLIQEEKLPLAGEEKILSVIKGSLNQELFAVGTDSGRIITGEVKFTSRFSDEGRTIVPSLSIQETWDVPVEQGKNEQGQSVADTIPNHVERLAFARNEDYARFYAWIDHQGRSFVRIFDADDEKDHLHHLTGSTGDSPVSALTISHNGENLILAKEDGNLYWFNLDDFENIELKDRWQASERPVSALNYLLGDQAIVIGNTEGSVEVWFPVRTPANLLKFRKIHTFESHPAAVTQVYSSPRNRNFLTIDAGGSARLHYSTTGKTQLKFKPADYPVYAGSFAPKSDGILVIDSHRQFSLYHLNNPHPETTFKTLSGKVWYEGYPEPEFVWQSTGGSDEFESKLSLIPLIFGTLKGTLYAMLFSLPIAILAAIYVSQFVPAWLSRSIKPTVEIMAALPSVVIGFLAGLYFSPLFEKYLVSTFVFIAFLPVIFIISVFLWRSVPEEKRVRMPRGWEVLYTLPILVVTLVLALIMGKPFENLLFDGNFQQWLYATWNITYETRNSFVVGFALGFAVIPIIFTVAEDALANVPESLRSASLALGASRWQTVRRVVIPAASGGIFAATMLGLGRAVGETMIVLMATGNTPILDLSPFNGFRAMSACIAVEIPEAPVGGTLYRVLFLTALLLFLFTFVLNTLSSMIGERLRKKYARF
jgi:phosphate transport system permease protein